MATVEYEMLKELFDEKLDRLHDLQIQTLEMTKEAREEAKSANTQASKTNGRVTALEGLTTKLSEETHIVRVMTKNKAVLIALAAALSGTSISQILPLISGL